MDEQIKRVRELEAENAELTHQRDALIDRVTILEYRIRWSSLTPREYDEILKEMRETS